MHIYRSESTSLFFFCILLIGVALLYGGSSVYALLWCSLCLFAALLCMPHPAKLCTFQLLLGQWKIKAAAICLALFLLWITITTFYFSIDFYVSFVSLVWWMLGALVFVTTFFFASTENCKKISVCIVAVASLLVIVGEMMFVTESNEYLRLGSLFYEHNAFGGFLLLPLFLSLSYLVGVDSGKKSLKYAWMPYISSSLLLSGLILTFSRGSVLCFFLAALFCLIVHRKKMCSRGNIKNIMLVALTALLISGVLCGIRFSVMSSRGQDALSSDTHSSKINLLYKGETIQDNGLTLRFGYFKDAVRSIVHHPWIGVGMDNYSQVNKELHTSPGFYSADPHNLYLKMYAESGLGSLLFFVYIFFLIYALWRAVVRNESAVSTAFSLGLLAALLHNGIDVDWLYPVNSLLFFVAAGVVVRSGYLHFGEQKVSQKKSAAVFIYSIISLSAILLLVSTPLTLSLKHLEKGRAFLGNNMPEEAVAELLHAEKYNLFKNGDIDFYLSAAYFQTSQIGLAKKYILAALEHSSHNASYYNALAQVDREEGNEALEEQAYLTALRYNPTAGYETILSLGSLYVHQKRYQDEAALFSKYIPGYVYYAESGIFTSDPNYKEIYHSVVSMMLGLGFAYHELDDATKYQEAMKDLSTFTSKMKSLHPELQ